MMKTVAWLVPNLIEGSGGHRTILQHADYLQRKGCDVTLYLESDASHGTRETASDCIQRLFGYHFPKVNVGWGNIAPHDVIFATIWYSTKVVRDLLFPCKKFYFVQDWEACFNPMGDTYLFAENSYRYGLVPITIGNWLTHEIYRRFGIKGYSFDFCADTSIYKPLPNVQREPYSVAFICQPEKPRRGARFGIETLGIVKHFMPEVTIYMYGSQHASDLWYPTTNLGLLSLEECNLLYNRCTVGLCISSSNPSRIPFEMMAAGLPVVELYRENTVYDLPEKGTLLCDQTPESLAEGIMYLLQNRNEREVASAAALGYMKGRDLAFGYEQFYKAVQKVVHEGTATHTFVPPKYLYTLPPIIAPVYSNMAMYARTMSADIRRPSAKKSLLDKLCNIIKLLWNPYASRYHRQL